jgi:TonB-linked SusC/RagA family outer membrane protein
MGKLRTLCAVLALAAVPSVASAQSQGTVSGRVTAQETGSALSGVQVRVQGTARSTVTDADGQYRLTAVPTGSRTITASSIGRESATRTVTVVDGQTATANFALSTAAVQIEGLVVNAITGQQERKREVGANVTSIAVGELQKGPITKFADVLNGRSAGVQLQGVSGSTGTSQKVRIRGANSISLSNEPLMYVDGVLFNNGSGGLAVGGQDYSRLNDINPEDIENVEVLKGPAASALYGTAAANGVLLITTRRGRPGATRFRAYAETGRIEDQTEYPATYLTYEQTNAAGGAVILPTGQLNTASYKACPNHAAGLAAGTTGACTQTGTISFNALENSLTTPFSTGSRRKFGVNASGGTSTLNYFVSTDVENEDGVISYNTLDKFTGRANLDARLAGSLGVRVTAGYTNSQLGQVQGDNSAFSPLINGLLAKPVLLTDSTGAPTRVFYGFGLTNVDLANLVTNQHLDRFIIGTNANWQPFSWLTANGNVGLDYLGRFDFEGAQPGALPLASTFYTGGYRTSIRSATHQYTANGSGTARFDLASQLLSTTTGGASYTRERFRNTLCQGVGIVVGTQSCGATSSQFTINEQYSEVRTIGAFVQQQFAFRDRLFLAGSLRGDRNSAFGQDFEFVVYPSVNASWVVSEEPFFPESFNVLSNLRLRAAYGTSGLRPSFRDAITLLAPVSVTTPTGTSASGATLSRVGNANLKPERTTEVEFGFDAGAFDDRVALDVTYFRKESEDALIRRRLQPSFGLTNDQANTGSAFANLGSIRNWGTEVGLNVRAVERSQFRLSGRITATALRNRIDELGLNIQPITFNRGVQRHQEGFSAGAFFVAPYTYADLNGDRKISANEVKIDSSRFAIVQRASGEGLDTLNVAYAGPVLPTNSQALTLEATLFRYLTVTTLLDRRAGQKQFNFTEYFRCLQGINNQNTGCAAASDPNAPLADQARLVAATQLPAASRTLAGYVEDADFVKWRELSFTLGVPEALTRRFPATRGTSVTLAGRNLKTWTDYTGLDPEANETGSSRGFAAGDFFQGEFNTQPPVRYYTLRVDFHF